MKRARTWHAGHMLFTSAGFSTLSRSPSTSRGIPDHVPAAAGILVVRDGGNWQGYDSVVEERAAVRVKAEKLPEQKIRQINEAFYYRFWRQQMDLLRGRLHDKPVGGALAAAGSHASQRAA